MEHDHAVQIALLVNLRNKLVIQYDAERVLKSAGDYLCPSPTARRLKMKRQPFSGAPVWSGCRTMLGLNKADASNEYSLRKYAPIRRRCVSFNLACGSSASSISAARASKISIRFL